PGWRLLEHKFSTTHPTQDEATMSNYDDIPEVFRRAMEEMGWEPDTGDEGQKERRPGAPRPPERPNTPPRPPFRPFWANRRLWILVVILVILLSLGSLIRAYTDYLWFNNLGYGSVWLTQWSAKTVALLAFTVIAAAILLSNWLFAFRRASASNSNGFNL